MWMIIKKNFTFYTGYLLLVMSIVTGLWFLWGKAGNPLVVLFSGILQIMFVTGAALANEQYEEKHHGYAFLEILPLKTVDIIAAKFLLVLSSSAVLSGLLLLLYSQTPVKPHEALRIRSYFLICAGISIIICALTYIGIFSFGYTRFIMALLVFTTALGIVPMVILNVYRSRLDEIIQDALTRLQNINWGLNIPLVLMLFFSIMWLTVFIRDRRSADQL